MPRVIFIDRPSQNYDTSQIAEFGTGPIYLFDQYNPSIFQRESPIRVMARRLKELDFDPEKDIVCVIGSVQWIAFFFAHIGFNALNVLLFNRGTRAYELKKWNLGVINDDSWGSL